MDLYAAVLQNVAKEYEKTKDDQSEIKLIKNPRNDGGHCEKMNFKADKFYKIILPVALRSPEHFILFASCDDKQGKFHAFTTQEQNLLLTQYENDTQSFFLKFHRDVECISFFTNCL